MDRDPERFFLQEDPRLNRCEAWPSECFPQATFHYFKESGCVVTSLWNLCFYHQVPAFSERFPTPWELNEALKANGAFYPNANIEMARIQRVLPVDYLDRFAFDDKALLEQLEQGGMCLLRVEGHKSRYHYVLPLHSCGNSVACFDPKIGFVTLDDYNELYQIIRFRKLWKRFRPDA